MLLQHFGCCRWVFNWGLAKKTEAWQNTKKRLGRYDLDKQLPKLKRQPETEWLSAVNSQALQQSLVHLELAFDQFFQEKKGYPRFKSKHGPQSFSCPQNVAVSWELSTMAFPKIGPVRSVLSRTFEGQMKSVTVSCTPTGKYFASVLVENGRELPATKKHSEKTTVGVDVGLKHFATLSTGEKIENPRPFQRRMSRLQREQRRLSRQQKGSKNRNKQRLKVARIHERVADSRKDFLHKVSTRLLRENQAVAFETLKIQNMSASAQGTIENPGRNVKQKSGLNRSLLDAGWGMFFEFSKYKAAWNGKTILQIGMFRTSSRTSVCGYVNAELKLSDRVWTCPQCGRTYDPDIQAAENIKRWALYPENTVRRDTSE